MNRSRLPMFTTVLLLVFFYVPIVLLVLNSFNASRFSTSWTGFTFSWYAKLFKDEAIWSALTNTLIIAASSTLTAMVLGTMAAFAIHRYRTRLQRIHYTLIYTPLVVPDILMGISLLLFFVAMGLKLSLATIYIAHVTFCISYVAMVVLARLQDFDFSVIEASQDLGANWWQTTWRVLVPMLAPGIMAGGLLAFTLSIDDFVITFFVSGPGSTTLPVHIYGMIKRSRNLPIINALSTLLLVITFLAVWSSQRLTRENKT